MSKANGVFSRMKSLLTGMLSSTESGLTRLDLPAPPAPPPPLVRRPGTKGAGVPGNFHSFKLALEFTLNGSTYVAIPSLPMQEVLPNGQQRWATMTDPNYYGLPYSKENLSDPGFGLPRVKWEDDSSRGILARALENPEDLLGAEGRLFDDKILFRFERILCSGKNYVVYALFCPERNIRIAYGFSRKIFTAATAPQRGSP